MNFLIKRDLEIACEVKIRAMSVCWNAVHCKPPLPVYEVERQWKDTVKFI